MAIFRRTDVTAQGHAYISKVLSGKCGFFFTSLKAGDGRYEGDILDLTDMVSFRLDGRILSAKPTGKFTELECLLTNANLTAFMEFREIGVYVDDPDEGEILFAYTNAGDYPDPIGAYNGVFLHEEQFMLKVYTANIANIYAEITPAAFASQIQYDGAASGLDGDNVQEAIDSLASRLTPDTLIYTMPVGRADYFIRWMLYESTGGIYPPLESWGFTDSKMKEIPSRTAVDWNTGTMSVYALPGCAGDWTAEKYQEGVYLLSDAGNPGRSLFLVDSRIVLYLDAPNTLLCTVPVAAADYYAGWTLRESRGGISSPLEAWGFVNAVMTDVPCRTVTDANSGTVSVYAPQGYAGTWAAEPYQSRDGVYLVTEADGAGRTLVLMRR